MGQYAKAEPLYPGGASRSVESLLGPDHPELAGSLNNLAGVYRSMDQYAKAEPLYQRSLTILESQLGPDHPLVAVSLTQPGVLYLEQANSAQGGTALPAQPQDFRVPARAGSSPRGEIWPAKSGPWCMRQANAGRMRLRDRPSAGGSSAVTWPAPCPP